MRRLRGATSIGANLATIVTVAVVPDAVRIAGGEERVGAFVELSMDLIEQLRTVDEVADGPEPDRDRRDGHGGGERDPAAEAHDSRSTYPTPWTVWINRRPPSASSLRRRYPM